jgi:pimeloyl-ACP methyl ester carboxylesterase
MIWLIISKISNFTKKASMSYFIKNNGKKLHYNLTGKGETIVLVHGYLESSEIWNEFASKLSKQFRIIAIDLPGHGLSDIDDETNSMESMAFLIKLVIDALGIDKIFFAGHSLGGYVALAFLELFPEKLSGYCLFHSQPFADPPETIEKRLREIKIVEAGKKDLMYPDNIIKMFGEQNLEKFSHSVERSRLIASKISAEGIISVLNGMISRPPRVGFMEEGWVPCLWILGSDDRYIPCDAIQKKVCLPLNAKVVVLENSGHMGFVEEEDLAVEVISRFVKSLGTW